MAPANIITYFKDRPDLYFHKKYLTDSRERGKYYIMFIS